MPLIQAVHTSACRRQADKLQTGQYLSTLAKESRMHAKQQHISLADCYKAACWYKDPHKPAPHKWLWAMRFDHQNTA